MNAFPHTHNRKINKNQQESNGNQEMLMKTMVLLAHIKWFNNLSKNMFKHFSNEMLSWETVYGWLKWLHCIDAQTHHRSFLDIKENKQSIWCVDRWAGIATQNQLKWNVACCPLFGTRLDNKAVHYKTSANKKTKLTTMIIITDTNLYRLSDVLFFHFQQFFDYLIFVPFSSQF